MYVHIYACLLVRGPILSVHTNWQREGLWRREEPACLRRERRIPRKPTPASLPFLLPLVPNATGGCGGARLGRVLVQPVAELAQSVGQRIVLAAQLPHLRDQRLLLRRETMMRVTLDRPHTPSEHLRVHLCARNAT